MSVDDDNRKTIGKYTILEKIGEGGCGVVYKALDTELERTVAIKMLSSLEESFRQRFRREAKLIAKLDHERIVRVFDAGIGPDEPYLVQEFLTGEDLKQKINRQEEIPLVAKVNILREAADGLAHAHDLGIVHRDIKPGNIRVLDNGHAKIMDFGIAKQLHDATQQLTQVGFTVGTAAYVSPEQIEGGDIDSRADIFSFGVVAYELLVLDRPFPGETISRLFQQIISEKPESLAARMPPETPYRLTALIERCLEKAPDDRPQHMSEVVHELDLALAELADTQLAVHPAPPPPPARRASPATEAPPAPRAEGRRTAKKEHKDLPRWFKPVAVASVAIVILAAGLVILQSLPTSEAEPGAGSESVRQPGASGAAESTGTTAVTPPRLTAEDRAAAARSDANPDGRPADRAVPPAAVAVVAGSGSDDRSTGSSRDPGPEQATAPAATPIAVPGDPAQLILVSDNPRANEHLVPALRRRFDSVVMSPDAITGRDMHLAAGRTLVVTTSVAERTTTAYDTVLASCEVGISAQLQDAKSFEYLGTYSAASTEPTCAAAIRLAATELAGKLRIQ